MSTPGRPKGEYRSAQREGTPVGTQRSKRTTRGLPGFAAWGWRLGLAGWLCSTSVHGQPVQQTVPPARAAPPAAAPLQAADLAQVRSDEPRAFGYSVGDHVERRVVIDAPQGSVLDPASLPRKLRHGQQLELQDLALSSRSADGRQVWALHLRYQIFHAPQQARTLEMPPLRLQVKTPRGPQSLRVEAWPLTVSPLTPPEFSARQGLGELRPDDAPQVSRWTAAQRWRMAAAATLALVCGSYLVWSAFGLPWARARQRPFYRAWRALRHHAGPTEAAARRLHQALNEAADEVLFARGLPDFLAREPRYAELGPELDAFFRASDAHFFGATATATSAATPATTLSTTAPTPDNGGLSLQSLQHLSRQLRDAERGAT